MNEYIVIGRIVRAAGIRGEIKVKPITDDPARYKKLKAVYICSRPYRIEQCRIESDFVYLKLAGLDDRTSAEKLRDEFVEIDRINAVSPGEGSYFIADIIGCKLFTSDGAEVGKIVDIEQYGAADVFTATDGVRTVRFPFLKAATVKVAPESGVVIMDKAEFDRICVYED